MARLSVASAQPEWITLPIGPGGAPQQLDPNNPAQAFSSGGGTINLFDFQDLGHKYTAIRFVVRVDTGSPTFTPEATYFPAGPAEAGLNAPQPFTVAIGSCYGAPYGIDEMRPFWRLKMSGAGTGAWGLEGIPR